MGMVMVHGHGTQRSLRTRACISSLLISSSGFFYKAAGQLKRHLGFRLSLSVSHRRSQFPLRTLCPCVAMAHLSRLTALVARLPTHVSLPAAPSSRWLLLALGGRGGHAVRARLRAFGIVSLPCLQPRLNSRKNSCKPGVDRSPRPTQKRPPSANPTLPPPAPRAPPRACSKAVGEMKARAADA